MMNQLTKIVTLAIMLPVQCWSQQSSGSDTNLAAQLANPIASLISVPFQFNYDYGFGPQEVGKRMLLNIQPVTPFDLSTGGSIVVRTILPVIWQQEMANDSGVQFGLGDTLQSFFIVPKSAKTALGEFTIGAGPAVTWPTSTDPLLGLGTVGLGPTLVFLFQQSLDAGTLTWGALLNHQWGLLKTRTRAAELSSSFVQPFLSYTTPQAWTWTLNSESPYNWVSEEWTVPINLQLAKLTSIGKQKVQFLGGIRYWATTPENGPDKWGARFAVILLFPKA